jgi:uncharacterized OsmC-like protein
MTGNAMSDTDDKIIQVRLDQLQDYRFGVHFGGAIPVLAVDEPAPLGAGLGPSPTQLLGAAVGNCLSDSLLFALRKFKLAAEPIRCEVTSRVGRNAQGRERVLGMDAVLTLGAPGASLAHLDRVLGQFEAFCTVTQSVGAGIPITVGVVDSTGQRLK